MDLGYSRLALAVLASSLGFLLTRAAFRRLTLRSLLRAKLAGRVVCITGATSGIGKQLARLCFSYRSKLILISRSISSLEHVKSELLSEFSVSNDSDIVLIPQDLSQIDRIEELVSKIGAAFGRVDILINNAGMSFRGSISDSTISVHKQLMDVNYFSQVALVSSILPLMCDKHKPTTIVAVSSLQGRFALPFRSAYTASKHAVQAFYDSLRAEVACRNVRVCVVSPGYVNTQLSRNALTASGDAYGKLDATTEAGMSAEACAARILEAVVREEDEAVVARLHHRLVIAVRCLLPALYFAIMRRKAASDRRLYSK